MASSFIETQRVFISSPTSAFYGDSGTITRIDMHAPREDFVNIFVQLEDQFWPFSTRPVAFSAHELI